MNLASLIRFTISISMLLLVFALGLRPTEGVADFLLRRPGLLLRSLLAMNIIMPLLVYYLVAILDLPPPVEVALVALAVSPVPPILPAKQLKLTESEGYIYGLLVTASVFSVALVPLATAMIVAQTGTGVRVSAAAVLRIVASTILLPLVAGILVRRLWPDLAGRMAKIASPAGTLLLLVGLVALFLSQWPAIRSLIGDGTLLAITGFTCVGLVIGHALGGPDPQKRVVLALATATRHPAVALAVVTAVFPHERLAPAAVLLALVIGLLATAPYEAWRKRVRRRELENTVSTRKL